MTNNIPHGFKQSNSRKYSHGEIKGKFTGRYKKEKDKLVRISDGQALQLCERRASQITASRTRFYLVDASSLSRDYVSSLYGNEFEYLHLRYRIENINADGICGIVVIRESRPKPRRGTRR